MLKHNWACFKATYMPLYTMQRQRCKRVIESIFVRNIVKVLLRKCLTTALYINNKYGLFTCKKVSKSDKSMSLQYDKSISNVKCTYRKIQRKHITSCIENLNVPNIENFSTMCQNEIWCSLKCTRNSVNFDTRYSHSRPVLC